MRILVVGGAGYIGSHMVKRLCEEAHDVTTYDNLSSGHRDSVLGGRLVVGDLDDTRALNQAFAGGRFDAVMHFASFIQVGESVTSPDKYYRNNVANTLNLLDAMVAHDVQLFIFSSTAAIFGQPMQIPIDEAHAKNPVNPYGRTKWMVEQMLGDYNIAYGLRSVSLRYFNAAGADPEGLIGERHEPETHLIPLVLRAALGRAPHITIFGDDYDTSDGTCIRDYIHVSDLCDAHLLSLQQLMEKKETTAYNLGNGTGFSVREVVEAVRKVSDCEVPVQLGSRRPGDPARLVADSSRAKAELGWRPSYADLGTIVEHAWRWERCQPH